MYFTDWFNPIIQRNLLGESYLHCGQRRFSFTLLSEKVFAIDLKNCEIMGGSKFSAGYNVTTAKPWGAVVTLTVL